MEYFSNSSYGQQLIRLFAACFTRPSLKSFMLMAQGWALSSSHHTLTTYIRLSGAVKVKHFSRFYAFFSSSFYKVSEQLWKKVIQLSLCFMDAQQPIRIQVDDGTRKKNGRQINGASFYRNGAGSARQEYRTLWGLNWVWVSMSVPLKKWPGHTFTIRLGLRLYLKKSVAQALGQAYKTRSQLAREMVDLLAATLDGRLLMVSADGDYSTKEFLRQLPANVQVTVRFPVDANLYELPPAKEKGKRGPKHKKGALIGCPKALATQKQGWVAHPTDANTGVIQNYLSINYAALFLNRL